MARLPIPGSDDGSWGDILNSYLLQSLAADGSIKTGAVSTPQLADSSVTTPKLTDNAITSAKLAPSAVTTAHLSTGSVTNSAIADGTVSAAKLDTAAQAALTDARTPTAHAASHQSGGSDALTLAQSQVTNLTTDLAAKANTTHAHTSTDITDSTTVGRAVLTAADTTAAQAAVGLSLSSLTSTFVTRAAGMVVVDAGATLSTARPAGAACVLWRFSAGVDVGTDGANVTNAQAGDLYYVAGA